MANDFTNPLTNEHYQRLQAALNILAENVKLCDKMEMIGMDVSVYREDGAAMADWLENVRAIFWPETLPGGGHAGKRPRRSKQA